LKLLTDDAHTVSLSRLFIINDAFTEEVLPQVQSCTFLGQLQGIAPCTLVKYSKKVLNLIDESMNNLEYFDEVGSGTSVSICDLTVILVNLL